MTSSWKDIENHWFQLQNQSIFNLHAPCILINKDGDLFEITLSDLTNYIDNPPSISTKMIDDYINKAVEIGIEAAKAHFIDQNSPGISNFLDNLTTTTINSRNITLGCIDDIVEMVKTAKKGFTANPRQMLVIQMGEYRADVLLVSPPSIHGRSTIVS